MSRILVAFLLGGISGIPAGTIAQEAPAVSAPAGLDGDAPIEAIAVTPEGRDTLNAIIPELLRHPAYAQFKPMSLRAVAPFSQGIVTSEKIAAVEARLRHSAPQDAGAASEAQLDGNSPIETIAATPAGRRALEEYLPEVLSHPAYGQFKTMSLRALAPISEGIITEDKILSIENSLATD